MERSRKNKNLNLIVYDNFYNKLSIKMEKNIRCIKLEKENTKKLEKESGNLGNIRCIKNKGQRILIDDNDIKKRLRYYFYILFNQHSTHS